MAEADTQQTHTEPVVATIRPRVQPHVPVIDYADSHKLKDLMDPLEEPVIVKIPPSSPIKVYNQWLEDQSKKNDPTQIPSWRTRVWQVFYEKLLHVVQDLYGHHVSSTQTQLSSLDFRKAQKLDMKPSWRFRITPDEDMYLLEDVEAKIDGEIRHGHALIQFMFTEPYGHLDSDGEVPHTVLPVSPAHLRCTAKGRESTKLTVPSAEQNYVSHIDAGGMDIDDFGHSTTDMDSVDELTGYCSDSESAMSQID
ncbi:hypothetical protein OH77DRAFT_1437646 [Trametes cingulata]|nr:hypothetical protein OH77DRAFT_1437646 [Trametes cingulata]